MTTERWILVGDSIQTNVYEAPGPHAVPATELMAVNLAKNTGATINNLSWGGARMTDGGWPGFGWASNVAAIQRVCGPTPAKGVLVTLGLNDWGEPSVTGIGFITAMRTFIRACKSYGLIVVFLSPIWNAQGHIAKVKPDGSWTLPQWASFVANVAYEEGAHHISGYSAPLLPEHFADDSHLNTAGHLVLEPYTRQKVNALGYMA
jgi:hypothetical protein